MDTHATENHANTSIEALYHKLKTLPRDTLGERIHRISAQFIGRPYVLGALGESTGARYDQFPLYRTDAFDCDTYVNTVLALALSDSLSTFQHCIRHVRYLNGHISYLQRNHFTSIDWNKNNQDRGILKDITVEITNQNHQPVAKWAHAVIDKSNWYAHLPLSTIRLEHSDAIGRARRLTELHARGNIFKAKQASTPYLPLSALFPDAIHPDQHLFAQIPQGAVIEIVRPNWDLRKEIGTALNISHMGFAVWKDKALYFRNASSLEHQVVDVLMVDYLKAALKSPTIKGINVQVVVPGALGRC